MVSGFLFLIFLSLTLLFGYVFSKKILLENRLVALIPLSIIIGLNAYNFFVNVISYFISIKLSAWLVLVLFFVVSIFWIYKSGYKWLFLLDSNSFDKRKSIFIFLVAILISFFSGIVAIKSLALDDLFIGHIPLSVTIAEGNFPVMDPSLPDRSLSYHYGSDLMTAIFNLTSKIPFWLGYDLQIIFFTGSLFLLLFILIYEVTKSYRASIVGSFLFFYGTGFQWLYLFTEGLPNFWDKFMLGKEVEAFWSFLTFVAFPKLNTSFIFGMNNHSTIIGVPVLVLALIYYFKSLRVKDSKLSRTYILFSGVSFGYLALNLETYFIITSLALFSLVILYLLSKKIINLDNFFDQIDGRKFFINTFLFFAISLSLAFFQGGVISNIFTDSDTEKVHFVNNFSDFMYFDLAPDPAKTNDPNTFIRLFSYDFFLQFGLPLLLIIPAGIYVFRQRKIETLLLLVLAGGAFLVPFLFRLPSRNWEISRFFLIAIPFFSMLVGIYLSRVYENNINKKIKYLIVVGILFVAISGVLSQMIFSISNLDRFGSVGPLFMKPPTGSKLEQESFVWIKKNTTLNNRFFPYDPEFIRHTARFTPGVFEYFTFNYRSLEKQLYSDIVNNCSKEAVNFFKIEYFFIGPLFPIKDYKNCMEDLGAKIVFNMVDPETGDYRYIYKLN